MGVTCCKLNKIIWTSLSFSLKCKIRSRKFHIMKQLSKVCSETQLKIYTCIQNKIAFTKSSIMLSEVSSNHKTTRISDFLL